MTTFTGEDPALPEEHDCTDGCDGSHAHKWEISPHPYNSSEFDTFVTDSDQAARSAVLAVAEQQWDACESGMTRTITIKCNAQGERNDAG
jgi:hypothetical protein